MNIENKLIKLPYLADSHELDAMWSLISFNAFDTVIQIFFQEFLTSILNFLIEKGTDLQRFKPKYFVLNYIFILNKTEKFDYV